jgi:hypothetical protein
MMMGCKIYGFGVKLNLYFTNPHHRHHFIENLEFNFLGSYWKVFEVLRAKLASCFECKYFPHDGEN